MTSSPLVSLFLAAAHDGKLEDVQKFLVAGVAVNSQNEEGETALLHASRGGYKNIVEYLIGKKADVNLPNKKGSAPLLGAAMRGHGAVAKYLLDCKANIGQKTESEDTAVSLAVWKDHTDTALMLIKAGADVKRIDQFGETPLHDTCKNGNATLCQAVLPHFSNVDIQSKTGTTPLMFAAQKGSAACMRLLLAKNAATNLRDQTGQTAGDLAADEECRTLAGGVSGPSVYIQQVQAVFAERKWRCGDVQVSGQSERLGLAFSRDAPVTTQQMHASITRRTGLIVISTCAFRVPEDRRASVADLMARANYDLQNKQLGNFEMDFKDGELRYKTSVLFGNATDIKDFVRLFMKHHLDDTYVHFVEAAGKVSTGTSVSDAHSSFKTKSSL
jgi:ankyrin repeat protein